MQVLFVADVVARRHLDRPEDTDYEMTTEETVSRILAHLRTAGYDADHIDSPEEIPKRASKYDRNETVVLSIWSGEKNRNRRALVPAICESFGIRYVGADAYAALVTADKKLAKVFCAHMGVHVPADIVVRHEVDLPLIDCLQPPLVIKPLLEGGSIGISPSSLVQDHKKAKEKAIWILKNFHQPALVERFVPGREVNFCLLKQGDGIRLRCIEILMDNDPLYFQENIFSCLEKRDPSLKKKRRYIDISDSISPQEAQKIVSIFQSLGKVDFMRIDGKWDGMTFTCLELSCDPDISENSAFFAACGLSLWFRSHEMW